MKNKFLRLTLNVVWATGLAPLVSSQDLPLLVLGDPIFGEEDWQLGFSVDLDSEGDTLAVGTPDYRYLNDGIWTTAGRVAVFDLGADGWVKAQELEGSNGSRFGSSVQLSADGETLIIGVPRDDLGAGPMSGAVYRYGKADGVFALEGNPIAGKSSYEYFGESVSISADANFLVAGARWADSISMQNVGAARIYEWDGEQWLERADLTRNAGDSLFGYSVSISDDGAVVAVGSPWMYKPGEDFLNNAGEVSLFQRSGNVWVAKGTPITGSLSNQNFGWSIGLNENGNIVAIGAGGFGLNGELAGGAWVYAWSGEANDWLQLGATIEGELRSETGRSVALSRDGSILLVGSTKADNGDIEGSGRVVTYSLAENQWQPVSTVYGEDRYNEYTGYSLALNGDTDVAAVGSYGNNQGVTLSGSIYVYGLDQDADGVANIRDAFPQDPTETIDTDGDGTGNNADSDDDGDGYVDVFEDFAGADSLDSTDAEISESFAKEMALPILDLEREKGISAVTSNPSSYSLYTASDVSVAEATARTAGQSDVTSDPSSYSLYTATDLSAAEAAARTLGQQDVTASPETYELATMAQISAAAEAARTIVNVSARVALGEDEIVTPGFVVLGEQKKMLIRAVGPKLADLGVGSPLPNPKMTVYKTRYDGNPPDLVATIDDWKADNDNVAEIVSAMNSAGAFPLEPAETFQGRPFMTDDTSSAAALVTLDIGVYTVQVSSADEGVGEVLVEVYEIVE